MSLAEAVDVTLHGIQNGSVYALLAAGFAITLSTSKVLNFAHGHLFMAGTVAAWILLAELALPLPLALMLSVLAIGVIGIIEEQVAIRPVVRMSGEWGWALSTIGFGAILSWFAAEVLDNEVRAVDYYLPKQYWEVSGITVNLHLMMMVGITIVVGAFLWAFFDRTVTGKALRAIAQDADAASLRGIDVPRLRTFAFFVGAALAGGTGFMLTPFSLADAFVGLNLVLKAFVASVIGGTSSILGAIAGGFILALIEEWGVELAGISYRDTVVVVLLLAIMLVRTEGLFGRQGRVV